MISGIFILSVTLSSSRADNYLSDGHNALTEDQHCYLENQLN